MIRAFDDARAKVWGDDQRRADAASGDRTTACQWLDVGATPELVMEVALRQFGWMLANKRDLPKTLKFIDSDVRSASRASRDRESDSEFDPVRSQWEARAREYIQDGSWLEHIYGPKPRHPRCRMPIDLQKRCLAAMGNPANDNAVDDPAGPRSALTPSATEIGSEKEGQA